MRSRPPIWRRLKVPSDLILHRLHVVIQLAMGWQDQHLYEFRAGPWRFQAAEQAEPPDGFFNVRPPRDSRTVRLWEVAPEPGSALIYEYDFGDSWMHRVAVEKILPPDPDLGDAVCLAGRRACPPEDCGGIEGYRALLYAHLHADDPDVSDWLGVLATGFDPARFEVDEVNRRLAMSGSAWRAEPG